MRSTEVADRLAIGDLVARYCDAVARADEATFASCWAPDARWTGPGLDRSGVDEIVRAWSRMRARYTVALQGILSGSVRVQGPRASGTWWVREILVTTDGATRETTGRYDDEYVCGVDAWRFATRAFTPTPAAT